MKRKHHGLLAIGIILLALGAAVAFFFSGYWRTDEFGRPGGGASFSDPAVLGQSLSMEIRQLNNNLEYLVQTAEPDPAQVDLTLFGYHKPKSAEVETSSNDESQPLPMNYRLSFAFCSASKNYCILNGIFLAEGNQIEDGGKVLKIEPDRVLVQKDEFTKWITTNTKAPTLSQLSQIKINPNHQPRGSLND